jgi:hypothetical protein
MATNHTNTSITKKPSALEKFSIGFEYDRTWNEAKNSVQLRPGKK